MAIDLDAMGQRAAETFLDLLEQIDASDDSELAKVDTMLRAANTCALIVIASKLRDGTIDVDVPDGVRATAMIMQD